MKLTFEHHGQHHLYKAPRHMSAFRAGQLSEDGLKSKPWLLRKIIGGTERIFTLPANNKEAVRQAKDFLNASTNKPAELAEFLAAKAARKSITIQQLATKWFHAGLPFNKTKSRPPEAAARLKATVERALNWWSNKPVATVVPTVIEDFAGWRKPALTSADRELAALSSLCDWAVLTGEVDKNPFAKRPTFAEVKQHCHEACPDSDEVLHRMLAAMFEPVADAHHQKAIRQTILAGGSLCFSALTGLRPGEPSLLFHLPMLAEAPASTRDLKPGSIFRDKLGLLRMKVARLKNGQNPFVTIHPAAEEFLSAWRAWLARNKVNEDDDTLKDWRKLYADLKPAEAARLSTEERPLFPLGTHDQTTLNRALDRASDRLELPHFKPHGFGRAFYVKVRRSQGEDDATIAGELGQTTNGDLIRSVYGDPQDLIGGQLFDWLPAGSLPAWRLLGASAAQTVTKVDTSLDT